MWVAESGGEWSLGEIVRECDCVAGPLTSSSFSGTPQLHTQLGTHKFEMCLKIELFFMELFPDVIVVWSQSYIDPWIREPWWQLEELRSLRSGNPELVKLS